jgi:hypothetical protein
VLAHGMRKHGMPSREWIEARSELNDLVRAAREIDWLIKVPDASRARLPVLARRRAGTGVLSRRYSSDCRNAIRSLI